MGNSTSCPIEHMPEDPEPFLSNGQLNFKAHDVGWIIAGFFGAIGCVASAWLIKKHLEFYTNSSQQRYIVRILFMVPLYAIYSWLSYFKWKDAIYYQLMRDCYEAVVIASFFYLLLSYIGETEADQAEAFKAVRFKKWIWPLGSLKYKPSGPYFLVIMKWSIGQYWIFRPGCTLAAVATQAFNLYCLESWSPRYSHVWTSFLISISVTIAMYAVLQFYVTMKEELSPYKPLMKFFAVKAVVFLTFWQESSLSILTMAGVIKPTSYWSAAEIQVGISAILACFEMAIFGFMHIKAFTYLPYRPALADPAKRAFQKTPKGRAFLDVLDFRDVGRELRDGTKQFGRKLVGKDVEKPQEEDHHERVFGRSRLLGRKQAVLEEEKEELETGLLRAKEQGTKEEDLDDHAAPWANTATAFSPSMDSPGLLHHQYQQVLGKDEYERMIPKSSTGVLYPIPSPSLDSGNQRIKFPAPESDAGDTVYSPSRWRNRIFGGRGGRTPAPSTVAPEVIPATAQRYDYISPATQNTTYTTPVSYTLSPPNQPSRSAYGPPAPKNGIRMPDPLSPSRYPGFNEQARRSNVCGPCTGRVGDEHPCSAFARLIFFGLRWWQ